MSAAPRSPEPTNETSAGAIALILARAGSKGTPGKNAAMIAGKPCVEWTILAAGESSSIDAIVLSTDCIRVREVGRRHNIHLVQRPVELATDTATIDDAARHAVLELERLRGTPLAPRAPIVILYANVPVRPHGLIDQCVRTLTETAAESVQSYSPVGKHHPWWTCVVEENGHIRPFDGSPDSPLFRGIYRRQELPPAHIPDGGVMVVTRRALMLELTDAPEGPHRFLGPTSSRRGVVSPEGSVIDIDSPHDLHVADAVLKSTRSTHRWERRVIGVARRAG